MNWINTHGFTVLCIYYIASSIISTMPSKAAWGGPGYAWFYDILHMLAANAGRVIPQLRMAKDDRSPADTSQPPSSGPNPTP